jgi:hypothetical protein
MPPRKSFSHVLCPSPLVSQHMSDRVVTVRTPRVVYVVRRPHVRAVYRCDKPRHIALGSLSIIGYRLGRGWSNTVIESPLRKRWWARKYLFKNLRTGLFRRQMIMWRSAARLCRSSGCDPSPACVASRLVPHGWSAVSERIGAKRSFPAVRRQLNSVRTLVAAKRPLRHKSSRRHEGM